MIKDVEDNRQGDYVAKKDVISPSLSLKKRGIMHIYKFQDPKTKFQGKLQEIRYKIQETNYKQKTNANNQELMLESLR
ncbi:MAG: hypothetical protein A2158_05705 [Chloroflexi bacterium RBG_13_46_14]|nr:MAG: hypothetical protein A2158_05705 [Chloroflexi bacterium RBG_13_46_14]